MSEERGATGEEKLQQDPSEHICQHRIVRFDDEFLRRRPTLCARRGRVCDLQ
mgnify:CR=1 FL=1